MGHALFFLLTLLSGRALAVELTEVLPSLLDDAEASVAASGTLTPKFFNFGYQVSSEVGVGDVFELGKTLEVEFHFERVAP